jgi:putative restriction endonuclease
MRRGGHRGQRVRLQAVDWVERVASMRQWTRQGERAPHKPLLLLYALGHFQRNGDQPIPFSEAEAQLGRLLREFGPPRGTSAAYPFHHLTSDGLWTVTTDRGEGSPGSAPTALRGLHAAGRLAPDLVWSLRSQPHLLPQLARAILDDNFEPSLHEDICAEAGLDLETAETVPRSGRARRGRDPQFRARVLVAYEYRCAFCGYDGWLGGTMVGLDAAHVRWRALGGPDEVANGLCLCALHHKLFDKGVLGISGQQVAVSAHFVGRSQAAESLVLSLSDREVARPQQGFPAVSGLHAAWHAREVFRAPARGGAGLASTPATAGPAVS